MTKLNLELPNTNISVFSITDNITQLQDGYMNLNKDILKRPGLGLKLDIQDVFSLVTNNKIDGMFWFSDIAALIICCDGTVYSYNQTTLSILGTGVLLGGVPVTFDVCTDSENNNMPTLFMANGGPIISTVGPSIVTVSGANIPTRVTHVVCMDGYLISNDLDNPNLWVHSDALTPFTWSNDFSYSAQGKTDNIIALFSTKGRLWVVGANSLEPFYDSGNEIPFVRIDGGLIEVGCVSPYAYCKRGSDVYLLNTNREFTVIPSGSYEPIILSQSYASRLKEVATTSDATCDYIVTSGGHDFITLNFPDEDLTLVYDVQMKAFYEWGLWDPNTDTYSSFLGQFFVYVPTWNLSLIGSRNSSKIYEISEEYTSDNSELIRLIMKTGTYDFGDIMKYKSLNRLFLHLVKGFGLGVTPDNVSSTVSLEVKTDFTQTWWNPSFLVDTSALVDLGVLGATSLIDSSIQGGLFRCITFRIIHEDDCKFSLCGIYLDYTIE